MDRRSFIKLTGISSLSYILNPSFSIAQSINERVVKSHCNICPWGCGVNIYVSKGKITRVEGMLEDPENMGILCEKGRALKDIVACLPNDEDWGKGRG
jgi:anaerobic selenocysteine-containing dehydrogenase